MTSDDAPPAARGRDWSALALLCGLFSLGWAVAIVLPRVDDLPAWPAASVGVLALVLARLPGRAFPRGLGAFCGALGIVVGVGKILALWGLLELLSGHSPGRVFMSYM